MIEQMKTWLAIIGAGTFALVVVFLKGRAEGKRDALEDYYEQQGKLHDKFDEIDRQPVDFDQSVDRLRKRK